MLSSMDPKMTRCYPDCTEMGQAATEWEGKPLGSPLS